MNELPDELVYEIISYNETYNTKFNEINKKCRTIFTPFYISNADFQQAT